MSAADALKELEELLRSRRGGDPETSYSARLLGGDEDALLKKIGEEAGEVMLAAKGKGNLTAEMADLWYHCVAVLVRYNVSIADVIAELESRRGTSGIEEKAARQRK